jgi:hypothetical protein
MNKVISTMITVIWIWLASPQDISYIDWKLVFSQDEIEWVCYTITSEVNQKLYDILLDKVPSINKWDPIYAELWLGNDEKIWIEPGIFFSSEGFLSCTNGTKQIPTAYEDYLLSFYEKK